MNRFSLPLLLAALSSPVYAQDANSIPWGGFYAGLQIDALPGSEFSLDGFPVVSGDIDGTNFGGFLGYRYQFNQVVVGGEFDFTSGDVETSFAAPGFATTVDSQILMTRVGAEVGYDAGRLLPYATAGYARINFQDTTGGDNIADGSYFGLGVEYQTGRRSSVGAELLQHNFDSFSLAPDVNLDVTSFGLNFAVRF